MGGGGGSGLFQSWAHFITYGTRIVKEVTDEDIFLNTQIKLNSEFNRNKYIQNNPNYVGPIEVVLNKNEVDQGGKKDV